MIVVDSNVVAYLYLPGEYTAAAEALFGHAPEWAVPLLCVVSSATFSPAT